MLKFPIIYAVLNKSPLATVFIKTTFPNVSDPTKMLPALKEPEQGAVAERKKFVSILAVTFGFFALMCTLMAFSSFFYYRVHAHRYQRMSENVDFGLISDHFTLRSFSFEELHKATDGFKEVIGRNSIGEVYKGFISEGMKAVAISDFGLSKLLRPDQSGTLTGVRGTRGYLAPEWHKNTLITTKVDIYSFGVVLLEILCCTGDMEMDISCDDKMPFFTWVYNCFVTKELKRLIGDEEVDINMFEKMVKVGLLCVRDDPEARPSIKDVILMLEGTTDIPIPPTPIVQILL
ncbi:hypothetical protein L1987_67986 [Smallanthus sonchifolius]|uniref:Uncharacterized protein n=1 Tax=Smallanthus sonchifolius TaxID=185202 RepID=A0ACB9B3Z8_9ASTR|nr:hypothetical protein L1987_67986 [Smallanthus sonchifolius]